MVRCDSYIEGECTWGACQLAPWIPEDLGNANQWCQRAPRHGLTVVDYPKVGAVACFRPGGLYDPTYGHLGVVIAIAPRGASYEVREMNYSRFNAYDDRWTTAGQTFGFILPPGGGGSSGGAGVTATPAGLDGFLAVWGQVQNLLGPAIEQTIADTWAAGALLDNLSRS